jgi:phenylacetate-coenzyme A ligase PaaK-like adenylate-forming protein
MFSSIRRLRARRLRLAVEKQQEFYAIQRSPQEKRDWQLQKFNELWPGISTRVPFHTAMVHEEKAPRNFRSWEELRSFIPIADRALVQQRGNELVDTSRPADFVRTTGGSTSQPIQLPSWRSELDYANSDLWFARSWFGISPADNLFLLWGHSHLLGQGMPGKINALRRELKDRLLGYLRWSAYDLSAEGLRRGGEALIKFRPDYIIGYSVALDRFARVNADRASDFRSLALKAVIATAEAFPRADSASFTADVLGCPVAMEYGCVEGGPVAHQRPTDKYEIFWRHWFVEGIPSPEVPGAFEIILTSLYPRKFPLVRYRVGDLISQDPNAREFDQQFERVIGRCNDCITLPGGGTVHSEAFSHAVKECPFVLSFQVVQRGNGEIQFNYIPAPRYKTDEAEIRRRLGVIHPALRDISIRQVTAIPQTIAGKTRSIVSEAAHAR